MGLRGCYRNGLRWRSVARFASQKERTDDGRNVIIIIILLFIMIIRGNKLCLKELIPTWWIDALYTSKNAKLNKKYTVLEYIILGKHIYPLVRLAAV